MAITNKEEASKLPRILSDVIGYGTVVATLGVLFFFLVWPVAVIVSKAFLNDGNFTLQYFPLLFENELYKNSMINSLWIGVATTVVATLVSLPLAIINAKFEFPGKGILSGLLLVPMVMPPFVGAIGIRRFFARRGSVNLQLMEWGWIDQPIDWLGPENMFWAVIIMRFFTFTQLCISNLTAALANIDPIVSRK